MKKTKAITRRPGRYVRLELLKVKTTGDAVVERFSGFHGETGHFVVYNRAVKVSIETYPDVDFSGVESVKIGGQTFRRVSQ